MCADIITTGTKRPDSFVPEKRTCKWPESGLDNRLGKLLINAVHTAVIFLRMSHGSSMNAHDTLGSWARPRFSLCDMGLSVTWRRSVTLDPPTQCQRQPLGSVTATNASAISNTPLFPARSPQVSLKVTSWLPSVDQGHVVAQRWGLWQGL